MGDMYSKDTEVRFNWGQEALGGRVEKHHGGWVMLLPDDYEGVFAVRETQVWLPGEEAKEPDQGVELPSALPAEAADGELTAT